MDSSPKPVVFHHGLYSVLPIELVEALNQAYFLHLLATEPEKVIPPGKTLLSMMVHSELNSQQGRKQNEEVLLEQVKEVAHKAFWNEATESLSSPLPSVQLPRLKRLYNDLLEAVGPLFPPDHPIVKTLEAPLPPTSSPLHTALVFLKELLLALRQRCAPIRDEIVNELYTRLDDWRDPISNGKRQDVNRPHSQDSVEPPVSPLALLVVDTVKGIVSLADVMKSDFNTVVAGSMTEAQLRGVVVQQAKARERRVVLEIWEGRQELRGKSLRECWRSWVADISDTMEASFGTVSPDNRWLLRLSQALGLNIPISCNVPIARPHSKTQRTEDAQDEGATPTNELPPQFFFVSQKLLYIQNFLQAIAIAASLRSLTRLPVKSPTSNISPGNDFMDRVWTLLKAEIDAEEDESASANGSMGETKIINLADEVIRARRLSSPTGDLVPTEELHLRDAVERTLRPQDPVFLLLLRRLIDAITRQLLVNAGSGEALSPRGAGVPEVLKTGREHIDGRTGKRPRLVIPEDEVGSPHAARHSDHATGPSTVKGFEDPVLSRAISEVFGKISSCVIWIETVWGDLV